MKKSLIALAALATVATAAQAQSSVTIYGIMDAGFRSENKGQVTANSAFDSQQRLLAGNLSTSRLGFKGTEDLGGGLKANFTLESGITATTGASSQTTTSLFDRKSTVGLSGSWGAIDFGRNYNAGFLLGAARIIDANGLAFDSVTNTTITGNAAATGNIRINPVLSVVSNTSLGTTRADNQIAYSNKVGNVGVVLTRSIGGVAADTNAKQSTSGSLAYYGGSYNLGVAALEQKDTSGDKLNYVTAGGNVKFGSATLTASYSELKADKNYSGGQTLAVVTSTTQANPYGTVSNGGRSKWEVSHVGLTYDATPSVKAILAYYDLKLKGDGITTGTAQTVTLTGIYALSKRTDLYAVVDTSTSKDGAKQTAQGGDKNTGFMAGVRHTF